MCFNLTPQYKIKSCDKRQLYGSKNFFNKSKKSIYSLKTFSDRQFIVTGLINF
jgi:hypothetical protein